MQTTKIGNTDLTKNSDRIIAGVGSDNVEQFLIVIRLDERGFFRYLFLKFWLELYHYKATILQTMLAISRDKVLQ